MTIEQMCRDLLSQAINDDLVGGHRVPNWADPQRRSSGELVGMANLLRDLIASTAREGIIARCPPSEDPSSAWD